MRTLSRTAAAMVFVSGAILNPVHAGAPQLMIGLVATLCAVAVPRADAADLDAADEVRTMLINAYVLGGWSERDSETIAGVKLARMRDRQHDAELIDFQPQDPPGRLSEASDGVAVLVRLKVSRDGWLLADAHDYAWWLYAGLNDYPNAPEDHASPGGGVGAVSCLAYYADYQVCVNGQVQEHIRLWNSPCAFGNFVNNPCVNFPGSCPVSCPAPEVCAIQYIPVGTCRGVPAGSCMRLVRLTGPHSVDCNRITPDASGGCASCSPPASLSTNCEAALASACVHPSPCPSCPTTP